MDLFILMNLWILVQMMKEFIRTIDYDRLYNQLQIAIS